MQLVDTKTCPDLELLMRPPQMPARQCRKLAVRRFRPLDGLWLLMFFPHGFHVADSSLTSSSAEAGAADLLQDCRAAEEQCV